MGLIVSTGHRALAGDWLCRQGPAPRSALTDGRDAGVGGWLLGVMGVMGVIAGAVPLENLALRRALTTRELGGSGGLQWLEWVIHRFYQTASSMWADIGPRCTPPL